MINLLAFLQHLSLYLQCPIWSYRAHMLSFESMLFAEATTPTKYREKATNISRTNFICEAVISLLFIVSLLVDSLSLAVFALPTFQFHCIL